MKTIAVVVIVISIFLLVACDNMGDKRETVVDKRTTETVVNDKVEYINESERGNKDCMEVNKMIDPNEYEANKKMIAQELGMDVSNRELKFIMNFYYSIDNGLIKELSLETMDNSEELYIKLENDHEYRYYLNKGEVEAIYGITQDKWLVTSER